MLCPDQPGLEPQIVAGSASTQVWQIASRQAFPVRLAGEAVALTSEHDRTPVPISTQAPPR
jgi:hypothetical protein